MFQDSLDAEWMEINNVFSEVIRAVEDARQKALDPVEKRLVTAVTRQKNQQTHNHRSGNFYKGIVWGILSEKICFQEAKSENGRTRSAAQAAKRNW